MLVRGCLKNSSFYQPLERESDQRTASEGIDGEHAYLR